MMRTPILPTAFILMTLAMAGNASMFSAENFGTPAGAVTFQAHALAATQASAATRFSSRYTPLSNCGSGMTKKEEREAETHGSDIPSSCQGYGGYDIYISYSACASDIRARKGADSFPLASQAVDWLSEPPAVAGGPALARGSAVRDGPSSKGKTVEWRMAQAAGNAKPKPFAVILRVYEYGGDEQCATGGKITGEFLVVKGLKGYEHIDERVDVKATANPNVKARELADKGYRQ